MRLSISAFRYSLYVNYFLRNGVDLNSFLRIDSECVCKDDKVDKSAPPLPPPLPNHWVSKRRNNNKKKKDLKFQWNGNGNRIEQGKKLIKEELVDRFRQQTYLMNNLLVSQTLHKPTKL